MYHTGVREKNRCKDTPEDQYSSVQLFIKICEYFWCRNFGLNPKKRQQAGEYFVHLVTFFCTSEITNYFENSVSPSVRRLDLLTPFFLLHVMFSCSIFVSFIAVRRTFSSFFLP